MKKVLRNSLLMLLTALMLVSVFSLSAFALGDCRVMIHLVDYTEGEFKDTVTVYYYNEELDITYRAKLDYEDYAFGVKAGATIKNGDYELTIEYESTDDYEIKNADGSDIALNLDASGTSHNFEWVIIEKGAKVPVEDDTSAVEKPSNSDSSDSIEGSVDFSEGKRLWDEYLKAIEPLKDKIGSSQLLNDMEDPDIFSYELYKEHLGVSEEEFYSLDSYEKFVLYSAYAKISRNCARIKPKNEKQWNNSVIHLVYNMIDRSEGDDVSTSYRKLMDWNYLYYKETGKVFNFIEGFDDYELEEDNSGEVSDDDTDSSSEAASDVIVPSKKPNASNDATSSDNGTEEKEGIWGGVMSYIQGHVLTLALLLVLAIAVVVIVVYRKRKTIEDEE